MRAFPDRGALSSKRAEGLEVIGFHQPEHVVTQKPAARFWHHALAGWLERARIMHDRRRAIETLRALSDHHLADIGLERGDIDTYVKLGYPWPVMKPEARHVFAPSLQGCG